MFFLYSWCRTSRLLCQCQRVTSVIITVDNCKYSSARQFQLPCCSVSSAAVKKEASKEFFSDKYKPTSKDKTQFNQCLWGFRPVTVALMNYLAVNQSRLETEFSWVNYSISSNFSCIYYKTVIKHKLFISKLVEHDKVIKPSILEHKADIINRPLVCSFVSSKTL